MFGCAALVHQSHVVSLSRVQVIQILDRITGTTVHQHHTSSRAMSKWSTTLQMHLVTKLLKHQVMQLRHGHMQATMKCLSMFL